MRIDTSLWLCSVVLIGAISSGNAMRNNLPSDFVFTEIKNNMPEVYAQKFETRSDYSKWVLNNPMLAQKCKELVADGKDVFGGNDMRDYNRPINLEFETVLMDKISEMDIALSPEDLESLTADIKSPLVNVNLQNVFGNTALHYAVDAGNVDLVKIFLSRDDLKINLKNNAGKTACDYAQERELGEIVHMIKKHMHGMSKKFLLATSKK